MQIEIMPCTVEHLEKLIEAAEAFQSAYGIQVVDGYMPFEGALQHILKRLQASHQVINAKALRYLQRCSLFNWHFLQA